MTEFALLRALGLSSRQLSVWLSLENATLAAISLVTGTALGLVIAWVALPFVTVTQGRHAVPAGRGGRAVDDDRGARGDRHRGAVGRGRRPGLAAPPDRHGLGRCA